MLWSNKTEKGRLGVQGTAVWILQEPMRGLIDRDPEEMGGAWKDYDEAPLPI